MFLIKITPSRSGVSVWKTTESTLGAFFAFALGFAVVVLGGWIVYESREGSYFRWLLPVYLLFALAECVFLLWLKAWLEAGQHPIAPTLALKQRRWPIVIRPLFASWWVAHFLVAEVGLIAFERGFSFAGYSVGQIALRGTVYLGILFMISHSALLYLMLAVAAVYPSDRLVWGVWRWRLLIDLVVTIAGAIAAVPSIR